MDTIADGGNTTASSMLSHAYAAFASASLVPEHDASLYTVSPQHAHPAAKHR